jgi:ferredoxin
MSFVVTEGCIKCKFTDCVDVCPVSCFYEGATMLVIHQDDCIDCGICEPECPVDAIVPDSHPSATTWLDINARYSVIWPRIERSRPAPPDAEKYRGVPNKYPDHFSPLPFSNQP